MNTPTIEQIHQHGSVRNYQPKPVPREMVEAIIAAGQRASTSLNLQMYSVVAITDAGERERLRNLCGGQAHVAQAPVFLAWCADLSRLQRVCELQGYTQEAGYMENLLLAVVDVSIAMQNAALAAESLGLGICYIGGIRNHPKEIIDLLKLPSLTFPLVGMTLGWPENPPLIRPRLALDAVLHWGTYNSHDEKALREYDQIMLESGIYEGRGDGEGYGWMEHSARRVCLPMRTYLQESLKEAGFLSSED
ncbi:MAG: NADPH-dependent oxidoreductase [Chloroflexota bacterium]|nr:MAG: NADPH-dependent oxidoreductase [Chloroflexota bacterium]